MADIGGVELSYQALFDGASGLGWGKLNGGVGGSAPSLGEKQLFFVSWAQTWCSKIPQPAGPHRQKVSRIIFLPFSFAKMHAL